MKYKLSNGLDFAGKEIQKEHMYVQQYFRYHREHASGEDQPDEHES